MKVLHTSDWHLGRSLYGRKRYDEFISFLDWLVDIIAAEKVDVLLVAGDIFDTSTPSNRAQQMYYRFLCRVSATCCSHVIIIGGNHDSPSFLNAPRDLLLALNVHVVGSMMAQPEDEVIVLRKDDIPKAIVCAVPYLRDKDIRTAEPGETFEQKHEKLIDGLREHYHAVCAQAETLQQQYRESGLGTLPIIAMGHLFTAGGKTVEGDGVRELYVGSLAHVDSKAFPSSIDYLALGHLHVHQQVGGNPSLRYCGSPLPMGFGEALQQKKVLLVEFNEEKHIREIPVPCFQQLVRISGSLENILRSLETLTEEESSAWLEIEYTAAEHQGNLREHFEEIIDSSNMEILRIKNRQVMDRVMQSRSDEETLDDLDVMEVFNRCLDAFEVPREDRQNLLTIYHDVVKEIQESDDYAQ